MVLAVVIAALVPFRERLAQSHVTLALLLVVLASAATGGRRVGLAVAALAFGGFNWFFLAPYGTFALADPLDWFVLFAFLGTSVVASHLFHQVQREADEARERTDEVTTLATLGAEAMSAPRADGALRLVAATTREVMGVAACRVHVLRDATAASGATLVSTSSPDDPHEQPPGSASVTPIDLEPVRLVLERGHRVAVLAGGVVRVIGEETASLRESLVDAFAQRLLVPLRAGTLAIGVLDVDDARGIALSAPAERLLATLAYYAALGAERSRSEQAVERLEAMRESDRIRTAVLASLSHDLRTPLTTIKALAHGLGTLGDERSEIIEQEADRLTRFVADILDMSRLASDRFPLAPSVAPLDELVTAALQQVEGSFGARPILVHLPGDDAFPLARFDLTHTVRIVVNLLENARKYAPGDAPVELSVVRDGAMMRVTVADRGPGVALEERERIFDALYRPANAGPDAGSAGLGLAIARGLAEAQGGTLTYEPRQGGGSVFTLALPAAELRDIGLEAPSGA